MPSTLDPEILKGIFALFKGDSGSGKSVGALSWPDAHVSDFDKKMPAISLKHFPKKAVAYDTYKDIFAVSDKLEEWWIGGCPYETLIADSVTSLSQLCLTSTATLKGEETPKMLKKLQTTRGGGGQVEMMSIDYYNAEDRFIKYYLDVLKALWARDGKPKNVIVIAHVLSSESQPDLKTKMITKSRSILTAGRKVAAYIPAQFDDVWHFGFMRPELGASDERVKHVVTTEAFGDDSAKTAYNLPSVIDFTRKSLYDEVLKYLGPRVPTL